MKTEHILTKGEKEVTIKSCWNIIFVSTSEYLNVKCHKPNTPPCLSVLHLCNCIESSGASRIARGWMTRALNCGESAKIEATTLWSFCQKCQQPSHWHFFMSHHHYPGCRSAQIIREWKKWLYIAIFKTGITKCHVPILYWVNWGCQHCALSLML